VPRDQRDGGAADRELTDAKPTDSDPEFESVVSLDTGLEWRIKTKVKMTPGLLNPF
jgi:hypothetical protein